MVHSETREELLFREALAKSSDAERAAYLSVACSGEPALRARLEVLLEGHFKANGFLNSEPKPEWSKRSSISELTEKPGDQISRYKLLEKIGEGGCGVVYMAQQEEPVRRRVALKIIKLGMDTKQVVARFEAERQALALMDHAHIAKVFDAGSTETGRPYFVMELVRGTKITEYCDEHNLSTRERLDLFIQVCAAVQHAHQKGIIHRDIKPSNILVTVNDGIAVPKVIDFGIAKATNQQPLTDKTVFTAFEQFIGTPDYMSPEQAVMTSIDVDTRTDIYSLGVLLYELLTGKTPFDTQELLKAGLDEMRRTIREKEPMRPSTRLTTMLKEELTTTAKRRRIEPPKLISLLCGDLDWIVMKCLEKDRVRRYETANSLTADLQRYLNSEPIVARPPSKLYRFQKLVRRNKLLFAAAGAVLVALVAGLGISGWALLQERQARLRAVMAEREQGRLLAQARAAQATEARLREDAQRAQAVEAVLRNEAEKARQKESELRSTAEAQRKKAETEAAKSQQVAGFLEDMLQGVGPSVALGRDTTLLREILERTAERVGKDLTNQPEVEVELRTILARTYMALGLYQPASQMAHQAVETARKRLANEHPVTAGALTALSAVLQESADLGGAERASREALDIFRKLPGREKTELADAVVALAEVLAREGKLGEAEMLHREALSIRRRSSGDEHESVAYSLEFLGNVFLDEGKLNEAETALRESLGLAVKLHGNDHPLVASDLNSLGLVLKEQGKLPEAETMHRQSLATHRKLEGDRHPSTVSALNNLAIDLRVQGRLIEAEGMYREVLTLTRELLGPENPRVASVLNNLGVVLQSEAKMAEAETFLRQAVEMRRKLFGDQHPALATSLLNLSVNLRLQAKLPEAESLSRESLAIYAKAFGNDHRDLRQPAANLALTLLDQERFSEAEEPARQYLHLCQRLPEDWRLHHANTLLGRSLLGQKDFAEAEPILVAGCKGLNDRENKIDVLCKPDLKRAMECLVQLYEATGRPQQAAEWRTRQASTQQPEPPK